MVRVRVSPLGGSSIQHAEAVCILASSHRDNSIPPTLSVPVESALFTRRCHLDSEDSPSEQYQEGKLARQANFCGNFWFSLSTQSIP